MAWAELENYGHTPTAHSDGAESVVARCGLVTLHLTANEAAKFGHALIAAAQAAKDEPRRHVARTGDWKCHSQLDEVAFRSLGDPRALPAINAGEGGAS